MKMNQTIEGKNKDLVLTEATRIRGQQPFRGRVQVGAENNGRTICA
jgi:hypothetical protein